MPSRRRLPSFENSAFLTPPNQTVCPFSSQGCTTVEAFDQRNVRMVFLSGEIHHPPPHRSNRLPSSAVFDFPSARSHTQAKPPSSAPNNRLPSAENSRPFIFSLGSSNSNSPFLPLRSHTFTRR